MTKIYSILLILTGDVYFTEPEKTLKLTPKVSKKQWIKIINKILADKFVKDKIYSTKSK